MSDHVGSPMPAWALLRSREEFNRPSLPLLTVISAIGVAARDLTDGRAPSDDLSGYRVVRKGDLVVNKLWARFGAYGVASQDGIVSPAYWVLMIDRSRLEPRFVHHVLRSAAYLAEIGRISRNLPPNGYDLSWEQFRRLHIPVPSLELQRRVATFLDGQVSQIDRAIELRQRQMDLTTERFLSLMWGHFSDPAGPAVPLRHLAWWVEGPGIGAADFRDDGRPVIRLRGVKADTVTLDGCNYVDRSLAATRWAHLAIRAGELLISGSGSVRFPVVVPASVDGAIPYTGLIRVGVRGSRTTRNFLRYFLGSPVFTSQIDKFKTGVGIQHWGPSHLSQISVAATAIANQEAIVSALEWAEAKQAGVLVAFSRSLKLLQERKQALTTAAVTGEFDVTTASVQEVT